MKSHISVAIFRYWILNSVVSILLLFLRDVCENPKEKKLQKNKKKSPKKQQQTVEAKSIHSCNVTADKKGDGTAVVPAKYARTFISTSIIFYWD